MDREIAPFGVHPMKRTVLSAFLVAAFLLPVWPQLLPKKTVVRAEATGNSRKASSDLKHKVNSGRGNDLVRVIIQPVNAWNATIESTVQNSGGSNERQFGGQREAGMRPSRPVCAVRLTRHLEGSMDATIHLRTCST